MLFNSLQFLIFFTVITSLYFILPQAYRWFLLLAMSCVFYMAFIPKYILILFLTIVVDYSAGIFIENAREQRKKKAWLVVSLVSSVSILFVFKYFNFFRGNAVQIAHLFHWNYSLESLQIILPIGL